MLDQHIPVDAVLGLVQQVIAEVAGCSMQELAHEVETL